MFKIILSIWQKNRPPNEAIASREGGFEKSAFRVKRTRAALPYGLAEADAEGDALAAGEADGLADADADAEGSAVVASSLVR